MKEKSVLWLITASLLLWVGCHNAQKHEMRPVSYLQLAGDSLMIMDAEEVQRLATEVPNDSIYIFFYWSTYSPESLNQLAQFNTWKEDLRKEKIQTIGINSDFHSSYPYSLEPFLSKNSINIPVVLLSERKPIKFSEKIEWKGFVPFYLIASNDSVYSLKSITSLQDLFDSIESRK